MIINKYPMILMAPEVYELFGRIDPWALYPPFLEKVIAVTQKLLDNKTKFYWTQGYRTYQEQDNLYAKGRTAPGGKVTNARGGYSAHNFCCAVDGTKDTDISKPGLQPSWVKSHYKELADAAEAEGLEAGFYWKNFFDGPHIQLPLSKHGLSVSNLRKAHQKGGREAVYELLDKYKW